MLGYLQHQSDIRIETRIDDSQYDESSLIELRVPLNMPYQNRWTEFERHYGEIEIGGKHYAYVKRRVEGNVLVLKCLPNAQKDLIKNAEQEMLQVSHAATQDHSGSQSPLVKAVKAGLTDLDSFQFEWTTPSFIAPAGEYLVAKTSLLQPGCKHTPEQPPDHVPAV